jgi:hypothetical protein
MTKQRLLVIGGMLLGVLLLAGIALAMPSADYAINWDVITGAGHAATSSANYALVGTVGQTGATSSIDGVDYDLCVGFWCYGGECRVYLPIVMRDYS